MNIDNFLALNGFLVLLVASVSKGQFFNWKYSGNVTWAYNCNIPGQGMDIVPNSQENSTFIQCKSFCFRTPGCNFFTLDKSKFCLIKKDWTGKPKYDLGTTCAYINGSFSIPLLMTFYTQLHFAGDEWYKPVYSLFDSATTFEGATKYCQDPLVISDSLTLNQSLPDFLMYDDMINLALIINPEVYSGKLLWTNIYTSSLSNSDSAMVYGMAQNGTDNQLKMTNFPQLFCPPFNTFTTDAHWMKYKTRFDQSQPTIMRFVKDFRYSDTETKSWPNPDWFPGCWKEYNRGLPYASDFISIESQDPLKLPFVCQSFFGDPQNMKLTGKTQKLPYHLNSLMPSNIPKILHSLEFKSPDSTIPFDKLEGKLIVRFQPLTTVLQFIENFIMFLFIKKSILAI